MGSPLGKSTSKHTRILHLILDSPLHSFTGLLVLLSCTFVSPFESTHGLFAFIFTCVCQLFIISSILYSNLVVMVLKNAFSSALGS